MFVLRSLALPFLLFNTLLAQEIQFPSDDEESVTNITKLLESKRGTESYEHLVDSVISRGILKLTLALDRATLSNSGQSSDNIVFSPISVAGALALVLLGSHGATFNEVASIMGLATGVDIHDKSQLVHEHFGRLLSKLDRSTGIEYGSHLKVASAVFVQTDFPIRSVYKETSERLYKSEVLNLDFKSNPANAQSIINAWVAERTNSKIRSIMQEPPPSSTRVVIASALYFKAEWEKPFFDGATKRRQFFANGRKNPGTGQVEMMANGGTFPYYRDPILDSEIIGFPYKGNKTTMYVIVPNNSDKNRLMQLENSLTPADLERLVNSTKYTAAVVTFPKMKIETTIDLKGVLQKLGVTSLFNPSRANLALLSPGTGLKSTVSNVLTSLGNAIKNPIAAATSGDQGLLIFSRLGQPVNCTEIFNPNSNINTCQEVIPDSGRRVVYKKIDGKVGRQIKRRRRSTSLLSQTLDGIRNLLNQDPQLSAHENPGLYADQVLHKVYMDITESGTEAAAATSVSLSRDGGRVSLRVDVPFLFFIRHEETKIVLFWGSVHQPTPSFR